MPLIPSYFNAPINPEDRALAAELRQKVIPWSRTPFNPIQDDPNFDEKTLPVAPPEEEEEEENTGALDRVEPVPEWLELFFDLAWTVTFSGLSGNTPIKGGMTVLSFITFFVLAWWLWTAQTVYDTKFYVNDAWHRFLLLIQFLLFGALAGFTSGFDVSVGFKEPEKDAGEQAQAAYVKRAFQAISVIFFITRVILAIQYARVIRLARNRRLTSLYVIEGALLASAVLFLGAFLVTRANSDGHIHNGLKFAMWGMAVFLEVIAYCFSTMPRGLLTQGSMPARLSTLTTVVIGEGLNGFIDPITSAVKSVGFNAHVTGQIIICGLIIFFIFIIYFQSFRARHAPTEFRAKTVVFAHFPVQLFIILLLEGLKSILNILTLGNSLEYFGGLITSPYDPTSPGVIDAFKKIGIDVTELNGKIDALTGMVTPEVFNFDDPAISEAGITPEIFQTNERTTRNLAAAVLQLFRAFEAVDGPTEDKLNDYINSFAPNNQAVNDTATTMLTDEIFPILEKLIDGAAEERLAPAMWVGPIAGALLISLGLIMLVNGLARNRFAWWSFVSRIVVGICLCLLGVINVSAKALEAWTNNWLLPVIAISYALLYVIDYVIAVLQARELHRSKQEFERLRANATSDTQHRPLLDHQANSTATSTSGAHGKWQPEDPSQFPMPRLRA